MTPETPEKITYTPSNLPPVKPGTDGHMRPKDEATVAMCVAPVAVRIPYPANWNKPEGEMMDVPAGGHITSFGARDTYYNREFMDTSTLNGKILDPATDARAAEISDFFGTLGLRVLIVEAKRTVGVEVIGEVADEAVGHDLLTPEGPVTLGAGDVIVRSVRTGDIYRNSPAKRVERYAENGRVFSGPLPPDCR